MGATGATRPARGWLWAAVALLLTSALIAGALLRAATRDGGGAGLVMMGAAALAAAVFLSLEIISVLQGVQGREAVAHALRGLPPGFRCSGRVRVVGFGRRPVLVDHVVVTPSGRGYAIVVDGSTRPPAPGDPLDGVGPLVPVARRAAEAVAAAASAGVLGDRVPLHPGAKVEPCIVVARRPIAPGQRAGVWTAAAGEFGRSLATAPGS